MAIINRFLIARAHEVVLDVPAGLVQDDPYSSFILDDPAKVGNSGTSDFLGLVKKIVLLVDIRKNVINTNPKNLQVDPLPYNQYIRLTQKQFDDALFNGDITMNENTRGNQDEMIGWVQAGTSRPSLYYEDCIDNNRPGKIPKVDNYFNFEDLNLGNKIVRGPGAGDPLEVIKDLNVNETINNWGLSAAFFNGKIPPSTNFKNYMYQAISRRGSAYGYKFDKEELRNIRLGIANRQDHFDGNTETNLYGLHPITGQRELEKKVYTNPRDGSSWNISIGIQSYSQPTILGTCLPLNVTVVRPIDEEEEQDVIVTWNVSDSGGGANEDGTYDYDEEDEGPTIEKPFDLIPFCNEESIDRYRYPMVDKIQTASIIASAVKSGTFKNYNEDPGSSGEQDQFVYYIKNKERMSALGIIDPRDGLSELSTVPRGSIQYIKNIESCTLDVYPNFRDKDGDVPELVGPFVSKYLEYTRFSLQNKFFIKTPILSPIGITSEGLYQYSDGNSYLELHGESLLGCGRKFALSDIPEIFAEMYSTSEKLNVERYRFIIENATQYQNLVLTLGEVLGLDVMKNIVSSYKKQLISDVVDDISFGISDMDFAEVGSDPDWRTWLVGGGTAIINAFIKFYFMSDAKKKKVTVTNVAEILKALFSGYLAGLAIDQLYRNEEDLYRNTEAPSNQNLINFFKNRSEKDGALELYSYRFFDDFWSRDILSNVYLPNNGVIKTEKIENGIMSVTTDNIKIGSLVTDEDSGWYDGDRTIEELKKLQSGLSLPSRWKSIMRPIYQDLWYDQNAIKPAMVSTMPYLGQHITALELGDYETHRKKFGMKKNLYDEIDEIISEKIVDSEVLANIQSNRDNSGFFRTLIDDSNSLLDAFLDPLLDTLTQTATSLTFTDLFMKLGELFKKRDWSRLRSYIEWVNDAILFYGIGGNLDKIREAIDQLNQSFKTNGADAERTKQAVIELGRQLAEKMVDSLNDFIINTGLEYINRSLQVTQTSRISLSPRRVMKPGSVILKSKSGMYSTNKQPCPVIFLGFNDSAVMSTFSNLIPDGLNCLRFLSKDDKITIVNKSNQKFTGKIRFDDQPIDFAQRNLGNVQLSLNGTINTNSVQLIETKITQVPVINKRIRQYGRNPFLDIFYLNIIPDSAYVNEDSNDKIETAKNSKMHLSSTPSPFRYPTAKNMKFSKVMNSNIPSVFPAWWNEPAVVEGSAQGKFNYTSLVTSGLDGNYWKEYKDWNIGDVHFSQRKPNNILPAKDRWIMSTKRYANHRYAILEDKTYILDIYFGLLNLHVLGVSWDKILPLIQETKDAVTIVYDSSGVNESLSKIDEKILSSVWSKIRIMLNTDSPIVITGNTNFDSIYKTKQPIAVKSTLTIQNNTDYDATIVLADIRITSKDGTDKYGQRSDNLFYMGNSDIGVIPNQEGKLTIQKEDDLPLPTPAWYTDSLPYPEKMEVWSAKTTNLYGVKYPYIRVIPPRGKTDLDINFIPYGIEPQYKYEATLNIPVQIRKDNSGLGYTFNAKRLLTGKHILSQYTLSHIDNFDYDLRLSPIYFGIITDPNQPEAKQKMNVYIAHNTPEDIYFSRLTIENEGILDETQTDITNQVYSSTEKISIFNIDNSLKTTEDIAMMSNFSEVTGKGGIGRDVYLDTKIGITLDTKELSSKFASGFRLNSVYYADLVLEYMLAPRLNYNTFVQRKERQKIFFICY